MALRGLPSRAQLTLPRALSARGWLVSIADFTLASMLCGVAANLPQIVAFRILQGAAGAPLAPLCQAVLFNINPPERYGRAMALYMMGGVAAPVIGPVVGA